MFSKPNAIVYVRRGGLIIAGKHIKPARLTFAPDSVRNLEILDTDKFVQQCSQFFASHDAKGQRILIALDHSVVFSKAIDLDRSGKPALLAGNYGAAIPFAPGQRACLSVKSATNLRLFGANADFYTAIADALKAAGASRVVAIVPVAAYGIGDGEQLSSSLVEKLLADADTRGKADFSNVKPL